MIHGVVQVVDDFTEAEKAEILRMRNQPHLYERIVNSVAPTVRAIRIAIDCE